MDHANGIYYDLRINSFQIFAPTIPCASPAILPSLSVDGASWRADIASQV